MLQPDGISIWYISVQEVVCENTKIFFRTKVITLDDELLFPTLPGKERASKIWMQGEEFSSAIHPHSTLQA